MTMFIMITSKFVVYFDHDVCTFTMALNEHLWHIDLDLKMLHEHKIYANTKRLDFTLSIFGTLNLLSLWHKYIWI